MNYLYVNISMDYGSFPYGVNAGVLARGLGLGIGVSAMFHHHTSR